jgi:hypothetical protein
MHRHMLSGPPLSGRSLSGRPALFDDAGAVTAEYAIATIAAVGFAALLVVVLRSDEVRGLLLGLVTRALAMPS